MRNDDVGLIQRILAGDETAFVQSGQKVPETDSYACIPENWGFPYRRRYHAGNLPASLSEIGNLGRPDAVFKVALCNYGSPLYLVAPKKPATD